MKMSDLKTVVAHSEDRKFQIAAENIIAKWMRETNGELNILCTLIAAALVNTADRAADEECHAGYSSKDWEGYSENPCNV